jgi:hypothetical protein
MTFALHCQTFRNPWILRSSIRVNLEHPVLLPNSSAPSSGNIGQRGAASMAFMA